MINSSTTARGHGPYADDSYRHEDVAAALQRLSQERGVSFKEVVNSTLRAGLHGGRKAKPYRVPARPLGLRPGLDLDKALSLAAELEDVETVRKLHSD